MSYSAFVGHALRERRLQKDLALSDVARSAGLPVKDLIAIERCAGTPSVGALQRLARVLGLSLVTLAREARGGRPGGPALLGLEDIARAIADLPLDVGSKVDAALGAAARYALKASGGNQSAAARMLRMDRKKFIRKLAKANRRVAR